MATTNDRLKLLESGEARGILRPEHVAELNALRAAKAKSAPVKPTAKDIDGAQKANEAYEAAGSAIRTYGEIAPVLNRFNPGPVKGAIYDAVMPNGGGFWDTIGSTAGALVRPLLPQQDKDDYQVIDAAVNRNVKNWHKIEKGVQTAQDDVIAARTDFTPGNSTGANRRIIAKNKQEAELAQVRTLLHSKWVARYGSITKPSPTGRSFTEAVGIAERDFLAHRKRPQAPPSTRRDPNAGWSVQEVK